MNEQFKTICKMSQKELKKYAAKQLKEMYGEVNVCVSDGFVYAQGEFPVLLVAHMDTVHKKLPKTILYDIKKNSLSSPQGIGGDDRCGVYMIFEIIKKHNCSVLFCEDEEIGGIGAKKFTETEFAKELKFNYIIEFDRKGRNDAVFYNCENDEFEDFITKDYYKSSWGTFSDISVIAPFLGCAAVNLSCGYYNAHTTEEYVALAEMEKSIVEAIKIIDRTTDEDKFEYIEAAPTYWGGRYFDDYYGFGYDTGNRELLYYLIQFIDEKGQDQWWETTTYSEESAVGEFCINHPTIPYNDITDIYVDVI